MIKSLGNPPHVVGHTTVKLRLFVRDLDHENSTFSGGKYHLKGYLPPEKVAFSVIWVTNEQPKFYSSVTYNMLRISQ